MTEVDRLLAPVADSRVMVVDDNPANTTLVRRLLQRSGLDDVTEVTDSRTVAAMLPEVEPDLVVLDLRMPGVDGFEVLQEVQRYAAGTFLPVIVVTADDSRTAVQRALAMGAQDYLRKPFDAVELALRVRNLLLTRAATLELRRGRAMLSAQLDVFEPELSAVEADPEAVRARIQEVLRVDGFVIALQPIVEMRGRVVVGAEALSRFPAGPFATPGAWFAAARRVGLDVELEAAAAQRALELLPSRPADTLLAVNVSPRTLLAGLPRLVGRDQPWERVVLELTEHVPVEDYVPLNQALKRLRDRGTRLAVDDTGAGFASLRHILDLAPDIIKLDIGLIRGVDRDPGRAALAEMVVRFADRVGATVIAEGVESEAEWRALRRLGVPWGQGYFFGRPAIP